MPPMKRIALLAAFVGLTFFAFGQDANDVPEPYRVAFSEMQKRATEFPEVPVGTTAGQHTLFTTQVDAKTVGKVSAVGKVSGVNGAQLVCKTNGERSL